METDVNNTQNNTTQNNNTNNSENIKYLRETNEPTHAGTQERQLSRNLVTSF
jgi:hypothetical protein